MQEELEQLKAAAAQAQADKEAAVDAAAQQARRELREAQAQAAAAAKMQQQRAAQLNQRCCQLAEQANQLESALQQQVLAAQQTAASRQQQIVVSDCVEGSMLGVCYVHGRQLMGIAGLAQVHFARRPASCRHNSRPSTAAAVSPSSVQQQHAAHAPVVLAERGAHIEGCSGRPVAYLDPPECVQSLETLHVFLSVLIEKICSATTLQVLESQLQTRRQRELELEQQVAELTARVTELSGQISSAEVASKQSSHLERQV